jgi:hypothetical protein
VSQLISVESKHRSKNLKNWNSDRDLYRHAEFDNEGDRIELGVFPYEHTRKLDEYTAEKAHKYIRELTKNYPFQLRFAMALPLWERFAEEWCATGDEKRALGAI